MKASSCQLNCENLKQTGRWEYSSAFFRIIPWLSCSSGVLMFAESRWVEQGAHIKTPTIVSNFQVNGLWNHSTADHKASIQIYLDRRNISRQIWSNRKMLLNSVSLFIHTIKITSFFHFVTSIWIFLIELKTYYTRCNKIHGFYC